MVTLSASKEFLHTFKRNRMLYVELKLSFKIMTAGCLSISGLKRKLKRVKYSMLVREFYATLN